MGCLTTVQRQTVSGVQLGENPSHAGLLWIVKEHRLRLGLIGMPVVIRIWHQGVPLDYASYKYK